MAKRRITRRRQLYVDRALQGRILKRFVAIWLVYHIVLWNALFLYRYFQYRGELMAGAVPLPFVELYLDFTSKHYAVIVCALAVLPALLWDVLKLSHRIAGPLVRFQRAFADLAEGRRADRILIRKHDLVVELQDSFNAFLDRSGLCRSPHASDTADEPDAAGEAPDIPGDESLADDLREVQQAVSGGLVGSAAPSRVR